jgi:hypothetical protein
MAEAVREGKKALAPHQGAGAKATGWGPSMGVMTKRSRPNLELARRRGKDEILELRSDAELSRQITAGLLNEMAPMLFLGLMTLIGNNARRAGSSFRPQLRRRIGLELGLAQGIAHSFFVRFDGPSSQGERHSTSTASSG